MKIHEVLEYGYIVAGDAAFFATKEHLKHFHARSIPGLAFLGRPPFFPFSRAALSFARDFFDPPSLPKAIAWMFFMGSTLHKRRIIFGASKGH